MRFEDLYKYCCDFKYKINSILHSEGLPILSFLYFVTITSYYYILVSTLYSIATELFFTFHLLSAMIMCIILIIFYYYLYEDKLYVLNSK